MTASDNHSPPARRTGLWHKITEAAMTTEELVLPVCSACQTIQYPPREICRTCLNHQLEWHRVDTEGRLLSLTRLHASLEPFFRERAPWPVGLVKLDCGPVLYTHLSDGVDEIGQRVRVNNVVDESGQGVLVAVAGDGDELPG